METAIPLQPERLLERLQMLVHSSTLPAEALVPVDCFPIYYLLVSEIARMAAEEGGEPLYLFVDSQTAMQVDAVDGARLGAKKVFVFGDRPESWNNSSNITQIDMAELTSEHDLFLLALSPKLCFVLVCQQNGAAFSGAWTADRERVIDFARLLLSVAGTEDLEHLLKTVQRSDDDDRTMSNAMRLMSILAHQLALRQRDIAMDKDDLSSVLNILKAVSAKRRAHDILFVFVEQIARSVRLDRCSVVRVWGGDTVGHVVASHEDESVNDLIIDLEKYPELRRAMETRSKVVINDTRRDPIMRPFYEAIAASRITSLVVIPVILFDQNVGSLLLRAARIEGGFSLREISFCEIVAEAAANALERGHLFESIQKANERLEYLADTDGLTGLYNHRYFRQRLEGEFERAMRYSLPLSCAIMDIDNFKRVNDTYGHLQGDTVLRGIAATTLASVRKSDIVARYGGEEFVVIMTQTGAEGARTQAERMLRDIRETVFEGLPEGTVITVSIGVAQFDPATMLDCEALIRTADSALYNAKGSGKNKVIVGKPEGDNA
jgi:diguanylate cyclase (GGDEF)-like protein